jgi:hypothetical protein
MTALLHRNNSVVHLNLGSIVGGYPNRLGHDSCIALGKVFR